MAGVGECAGTVGLILAGASCDPDSCTLQFELLTSAGLDKAPFGEICTTCINVTIDGILEYAHFSERLSRWICLKTWVWDF